MSQKLMRNHWFPKGLANTMGMFDEIGKKLAKSGQDTVKKAKEFAEVTRINAQISEEQKALNGFFMQIGEKFFAAVADAPPEEYAPLCERIVAGRRRIAELQLEVQKVKNVRLCPKCGAECAANLQFCGACGEPLPPLSLQQPQPPDGGAAAQPQPQQQPPPDDGPAQGE
jgi:hypothetical protein